MVTIKNKSVNKEVKSKDTKVKIAPAKADVPFDPHSIIKYPLSTEKCIRQVEFENKLVFIVDKKATKREIKRAIETLFKVRVLKVNLQNAISGKKKAYIKLSPEHQASDVGANLGLI